MLDETGLFDVRYFAYLEDMDIALRGWWLGYRCVFVPSAIVHHQKSASAGHHSVFKAFHVERNRLWNLLKLFPWRLVAVSPAFTVYRYVLQSFAALTNRGAVGGFVRNYSRTRLIGVLLAATASALRGAPAALRGRREILRRRRLTSREFLRVLSRFKLKAIELALKD
jgi:GT2 family glycosyltransferase